MSDLISRETAISEIMSEPTETHYPSWYADKIKALPYADRPTVDKEYLIDLVQEAVYDGEACAKLMDMVDRPTGEWVYKANGNVECSVCGRERQIGWTNFCGGCGARMTGGKDDV